MNWKILGLSADRGVPEEADLAWFPGSTGALLPPLRMLCSSRPRIVTLHGAAPLTLAARECFPNSRKLAAGIIRHEVRRLVWRLPRLRATRVITVSNFARQELVEALSLPREHISPIYHGIDRRVFYPSLSHNPEQPYFLHVSTYQPLKNLERLVEAHQTCQFTKPVKLLLIASGLPRSLVAGTTDVEYIDESLSQERLAHYYRSAVAFVFPSLRESFGMPLLEAMASGCPVLTSRGSGCEEVVGGAATLVDPRSIPEIRAGLLRLARSRTYRSSLAAKGISRAVKFSWRRSASQHSELFSQLVDRGADRQGYRDRSRS